jgi:hypothetical protein
MIGKQLNNQAQSGPRLKSVVSVERNLATEAAARFFELVQSGEFLKASTASVITERWTPFLFDMPP